MATTTEKARSGAGARDSASPAARRPGSGGADRGGAATPEPKPVRLRPPTW